MFNKNNAKINYVEKQLEINNKNDPFQIRETVTIPARTITNFYVKVKNNDKKAGYTRCVRKVSDLRLYLRARALDWRLRGMSVTSSPSRTP